MADAAIDSTASVAPDRQRRRQAVRRRRAGRLRGRIARRDLRQGPRSRVGDDGQVVLHLDAASQGVVHDRRVAAGDRCRCSAGCGCTASSVAVRRRSGSARHIASSGSLALLFTLPVAYHCLWSLGFNPGGGSGRRLWHSIFGCLFFGAFTTKVLVVRSRRMPGWALPAVGATLFTVLVLIWLTSSLWFFRKVGIEL